MIVGGAAVIPHGRPIRRRFLPNHACGVGRAAYDHDVETVAVGDLVSRAREGDEAAWDLLVERYVGMVHAICRGHHLASDDAADVHRVVWLRLVEHLDRIRTPDAVGGWIAATARSECLRVLRAEGRAVFGDGGGDVPDAGIDVGLLVYERDRALMTAFGGLGDRCRQLLRLLMAVPAVQHTEVAAALDMAASSIGVRRARCLVQLRQGARLSDAAVDPAASASDDADDLLVDELRRVAAVADPVPAAWSEAARAAFAWVRLPGVPARLTYDSQPGADGWGSGSLSGAAVRTVRFTAGSGPDRLGIEVEVDIGADKLRIAGSLRPGRHAPVTAITPDGRTPAESDATGGFHVDELPRVPFCLLVGGAQPVKTGWIVA